MSPRRCACGAPLPAAMRGRPRIRCFDCAAEKLAAYQAAYYARNREKRAAYQAAYYARNREKRAAQKAAVG